MREVGAGITGEQILVRDPGVLVYGGASRATDVVEGARNTQEKVGSTEEEG
jgi:hypothetical protein